MWVMNAVNTTIYTANWTMYVNGIVTATATPAQGALLPLPLTRIESFLAGSDWGDTPTAAWYDAFRVYNYAVPSTIVPQLASLYGLNSAAISSTEDARVLAALNGRAPFFNCSFTGAGIQNIGIYPGYGWTPGSDPNDAASVQSFHTGLAFLGYNSGGYVNLATSTGAQSCGATLGQFGGPGFNAYGTAQQGWTFEIVFKLGSTETWSRSLILVMVLLATMMI